MNTKQKITVKASPSENKRTFVFNIEDMGFNKKEWDKLSEQDKYAAIQKELDGSPDQPYWQIDSYD